MYKGIKIFVGVIFSLAIVSLVYLMVGGKGKKTPATATKTQETKTAQTSQTGSQKLPTAPGGGLPVADNATKTQTAQDKSKVVQDQWKQCKTKTFSTSKSLFWNVQISEGIPTGGTYAKGTLNSDANFPVRVIIKSGSPNVDKIKARLVVGKSSLLRGNCTDVAPDGAVVLQVF